MRRTKTLDAHARKLFEEKGINMMVPWYMMAAYAYYVESNPIISDSLFDEMAKTMLDKWEEIEHYHKHYISKEDLKAGTYLGEYPTRTTSALEHLRTCGYES